MASRSKPFTTLGVAVFALVALGHLLRVALALDLVVGDLVVPPSVSVVATLVAGGLAIMIWRESHRKREPR